ncbi:Fe(3+)-hydroxamate ABC transporter permease FhuB [Rhizobium skierniewicense]|uniref:Fe(3+)-hydroxamate ABC transporter permease FhuB n=1 Tax=Rhizobium skierniewicense TaxID=984260 RepID=UPI0015723DB7|nr:Fe(3+)-hydroxamate ABC transporter permease FhuB [Rhizobium skierniewicense]NTF35061.1 Fe(3+)-hydroxamate ABC transporter permease FhuB [Rhizobium skierniewicense]
MASVTSEKASNSLPQKGTIVFLLIAVAALALALSGLGHSLPPAQWWAFISSAKISAPSEALVFYGFLPRIVVALVAGFALGLGGAVFQQVLGNQLAEPGLLGVSSGAGLALAASLLYAPTLWRSGPEVVALAGAGVALIVVLGVAFGRSMASNTLILAGVVVNLYCGALYSLLVLFNHDFLTDLLRWQAGSLQQSGWRGLTMLLPQVAVISGAIFLMQRPLMLLSLGDGTANTLGVSSTTMRILALACASMLAAFVTANFGIIGFIGLAAPALARTLWPNNKTTLLRSAVTGAVLLLLADQLVRILSQYAGDIPVGAAAGLLTGPLLVALSLRNRKPSLPHHDRPVQSSIKIRSTAKLTGTLAVFLIAVTFLAFFVGQSQMGWQIVRLSDMEPAVIWRLPRVLASVGAGACLSISGFILQRSLRNPLASPDLLGIGHGAGLGLAFAIILLPAASIWSKFAVASVGAVFVLGVVVFLSWRNAFHPEKTLLIGVGLGSTMNSLLVLVLAGGGPKAAALLSWFAGSTGGVSLDEALAVCVVAILALISGLLCHRWLELSSLGDATATSLGVPIKTSRALGLVTASVATAAATIVIGPLSFIGLMVPHLAGMVGFRRVADSLIGCALLGGLLMVFSDWLGRNLIWPWPMSPGLLAAFTGGPLLLCLIQRNERR